MGITSSFGICECCLLQDNPEDTSDETQYSDSSDSTSLSDSTSSDEEKPLRKKKRSKSKRFRKKKRKRKQQDREQSRDESYISSENDNEGARDKHRRRKKRKGPKKKKRNNESPLMEDMQRKLMEKSQNEIEKSNNEYDHVQNMYGMDSKTMELLMSVDVGGQNQNAPKPSMASLPSNPVPSEEHNDDQELPPVTGDMSSQLKSYTSDMMYVVGVTPNSVPLVDDEIEADEAYSDLIVDHGDTTPDLPIFTSGSHKELGDEQRNSLGGLDYETTPPETALRALNTLQEDEKNLDFTRLHKTLAHASSVKDANKVQFIIKSQYSNNAGMETDDSSLDDDERQEIERRKTDLEESKLVKMDSTKVLSAKLFRPGTATAWHEDEMDAMESAMNKHMDALHAQRSISRSAQLEDTDDSSLNEEERREIERRKTESKLIEADSTKVLAAKLLRPGTTTAWHEDEMDAMENAMSKHMKSLHAQSPEDSDFVTDDEFDANLDAKIVIKPFAKRGNKPESQLFRKKSEYKWDEDRLDQENEEMQAQLASLMMQHQQSAEDKI